MHAVLCYEKKTAGGRWLAVSEPEMAEMLYGPYPRTCGKCGGTISKPGPCPACEDKPYG
jgi:hypothetical protein